MPPRPLWYRKLPYILDELRSLPHPWVDRATLEFLLDVGTRRAQQIMAPCIANRVGPNGLADRDALIARLQQVAAGDEASYEMQRRRKVARLIDELRRDRMERPQVLVEAPTAVVNQELETLPPGVQLEPGCITIQFEAPLEALEKLLALAMAIGNDLDRFERRASRPAQAAGTME